MGKPTFEIAAQFGDQRGAKALIEHFKDAKLRFRHSRGMSFCKQIDEFCFLLRVDGEISSLEIAGCDNVVVDVEDRAVSVDIGVPVAIWSSSQNSVISAYLHDCYRKGLEMMVSKLEKSGVSVDPTIYVELDHALSAA